jgi:3-oxoacyl-[acyl-carrier protein] reductase
LFEKDSPSVAQTSKRLMRGVGRRVKGRSCIMSEPSLNGKVAIVTGAGRGIGRAIALAYAQAGAAIGCAARTSAEIDETVQKIQSLGGQSVAVQTDVTQLESVQHLLATVVEHFGGLDILVSFCWETPSG